MAGPPHEDAGGDDDDGGLALINAHAEQYHSGAFRCRCVDGKGRTLWSMRDFEPGDIVMAERPLLVVDVPAAVGPELGGEEPCGGGRSAAEAFRELSSLCERLDTEHTPLWYWCGLRSLTRADLGEDSPWEPLEEPLQRRLLLLHQGHGRTDSATEATVAVAEHLAPRLRDPLKLERCLQAWFHNAFDHSDPGPGNAVFFFPSFMSHSCLPNAVWHYDESNGFVLRACRRIVAGDEVAISYLDETSMIEDALTRRSLLFKTKGFWCTCERCAAEYDLSRGMQCPACREGSVFARSPCQESAEAEPGKAAAGQVLQPLRPSLYTEVSARDLSLWLTMGVPALQRSSGRFYYEVKLGRGCIEPQIGWATGLFEEADACSGEGVGDDEHSWGADGVRHRWWHNGHRECAASRWSRSWLEGDVIGCSIDLDSGEMAFSENGAWGASADFAFDPGGRSFFPAISTQGEFTFHLDASAFRFGPRDESFEPLMEPDAQSAPVDRWSPLQGAFAGSVCQSCGFRVSAEEARRLGRIERSVQRTLDGWEEKEDLSREEAEQGGEILAAELTQHVLLDKARDRLAKFHEGRGEHAEQVGLLRARCDFHAAAYPGLHCAHAWALEEYADALTVSAKAAFGAAPGRDARSNIIQMQQAQESYSEALRIFSTFFGSDREACVYLQSKLTCAGKVVGVMCEEAGDGEDVPSPDPAALI